MDNEWTKRIEELEAALVAAQERVKALEIALVKAKAISPSNAIAWQERAEKAEADNAALRKELDEARENKWPPSSVQEALNSGDGTYKP